MKYFMIVVTFLIIVTFLIFTGCATVYPECEEYLEDSEERAECQVEAREWRRAIDLENYNLCALYYSRSAGSYMIHKNHRHGSRDRVSSSDIRSDLKEFNCKKILGESWAEY